MANATLVSQKVQEIHLSNKLDQSGQIQLDSSFSLNVSFSPDGTRAVGKLTQTLRDKEFVGGKFTLSVELAGIFNCSGATTDEATLTQLKETYETQWNSTGKAALAGFADVPGTKIIVFYPKDGVSPIQKRQMVTQTGDNTCVIGIEGNFDDAQTGIFANALNKIDSRDDCTRLYLGVLLHEGLHGRTIAAAPRPDAVGLTLTTGSTCLVEGVLGEELLRTQDEVVDERGGFSRGEMRGVSDRIADHGIAVC